MYEAPEGRLLMVASDRISTYDVVHPTPIPDKGKVLTGLSAWWFERTHELCPNHLVSYTEVPEDVRGRAMLVERLEMVPVECVVRGYITGSGWKDYQAIGEVCGVELPAGLSESERLPEPIFTPATKAAEGDHDENVSFERAAEILGDRELLEELRRLSVALYELVAGHARERGIILADTKFEFGRDPAGQIVLADEVATPDSSRFWPAEGYRPGAAQPSFDKQFVRDWASGSGWDKSPPAPELPTTWWRARGSATSTPTTASPRGARPGGFAALDLVVLDQRVGEQALAHLRQPRRVLDVQLHEPADVDAADPAEAQRRQRALDGLALGIEDPGLRPDQDACPHGWPAPRALRLPNRSVEPEGGTAPVRSSQAPNGSPASRS